MITSTVGLTWVVLLIITGTTDLTVNTMDTVHFACKLITFCYFNSTSINVKMKLLMTYRNSHYGAELWDWRNKSTIDVRAIRGIRD